jgi:hypothetical protein
METPLSDLKLPTRVQNAVRRNGVDTIEKLLELPLGHLVGTRDFGEGALEAIGRAVFPWARMHCFYVDDWGMHHE